MNFDKLIYEFVKQLNSNDSKIENQLIIHELRVWLKNLAPEVAGLANGYQLYVNIGG